MARRNDRVIRWYEPSKYRNQKTEVDGIVFDSKKEANRYCELKLMEKAGEIRDLERQVKFVLIPAQFDRGVQVEREVTYVADFQYMEKRDGLWSLVVEDVKSPATKTDEYVIKRKLMLWVHHRRIREV